MTKAVFLDRDGVINQPAPEGQYVTCWEDFQILPGVVEGIAQLNRARFSVIVVTNQRCIAKGLLTAVELEQMHQRMSNALAQAGATIDGTYYCPHDIESSCNCRKPAPGMLLDASRSHGIELAASWMVGDSDSDIEAGRNAGCKTARLLPTNASGDGSEHAPDNLAAADISAPSLLDAVHQILVREGFAAASFAKVRTST